MPVTGAVAGKLDGAGPVFLLQTDLGAVTLMRGTDGGFCIHYDSRPSYGPRKGWPPDAKILKPRGRDCLELGPTLSHIDGKRTERFGECGSWLNRRGKEVKTVLRPARPCRKVEEVQSR